MTLHRDDRSSSRIAGPLAHRLRRGPVARANGQRARALALRPLPRQPRRVRRHRRAADRGDRLPARGRAAWSTGSPSAAGPAQPAGGGPARGAPRRASTRPTTAWWRSTRRAGWLALFWATILSGPSHANKLLAGYVALRALGIQANFVDVLLVQTLITFLLYFAPTPGASGIAELLSTAVMSVVRAAGADAALHPDLALHPQLLHHRLRLRRLLRAGSARGSRAIDETALAGSRQADPP